LYFEARASAGDPGQFELTVGEAEFTLSKSRTSSCRILAIPNVGVPEGRMVLR